MKTHSTHQIALPHGGQLSLGQTPLVMGILNVTPDSFSDGGQHDLLNTALAHARFMLTEGADIIDIGGESTRPGAAVVSVQEELDRVIPVIEALIAAGVTAPISVDTYKPLVADQAIQAGASIINDVHGLQGAPEMADIAALHHAPVIAMHWDKARDLEKPLLDEVDRYFVETLAIAHRAGIAPDQIILDPGFGFAKSVADNYALLNGFDSLAASSVIARSDGGSSRSESVISRSGMPILIGTSRKSMIGKLLGNQPDERLAGTIATNVLAYARGGHIFRVHDIRANRDALRVAQATLYGPPSDLG